MKRNKQIGWICLIIAGLLDLVWAYFVKLSHGFTVLGSAALAVFFLVISFFLLERGIREFGIGMSYGVFTGIGVAGTAIVGVLMLGESMSLMKVISLAVLLAGIIGLKFVEGGEEAES
jgi:quaternary ammonium compound-resistance protein SugE